MLDRVKVVPKSETTEWRFRSSLDKLTVGHTNGGFFLLDESVFSPLLGKPYGLNYVTLEPRR